tara:strand:+ start:10251 stop:10436 length:186 start_codon:yes stop_codon:yes gene_type:complete
MKHPAQNPRIDSRAAKTISMLSIIVAAVGKTRKYSHTNAVDDMTKPIVWANLFGGPGTGFT